jgi:hypothetical protein
VTSCFRIFSTVTRRDAPVISVLQINMATLVDHEKRLLHLGELYEQSFKKGGTFSECIEQCERSLSEYAGMAPFWRIRGRPI